MIQARMARMHQARIGRTSSLQDEWGLVKSLPKGASHFESTGPGDPVEDVRLARALMGQLLREQTAHFVV